MRGLAARVRARASRARSRLAGAGALLTLGLAAQAFPSRAQESAPSTPASEGLLVVEVRSAAAPIAGAEVRVGGKTGRTDAAGEARLTLPPGPVSLGVFAEGFAEAEATAVIAAGRATRVSVALRPALEVEEEVVVTATRSDRRIQDEPVRVEVVDREDIEEKALMTPGSVAMLLGETAGLRVQATAPSLGAANLRIQGLRGRYSALLSDGLPLYGVQGDSLSLLQVPPLDLGQVEIIKGAASALYGPSALSGVVNLVSQRPETRQRQLLANLSTQEAVDLTGWLVSPSAGRLSHTLLAGVHGQGRQDVDADGWSDLPRFLRGVIRPRLFWNDGRGGSLFATLGLMAEERRGGTEPGAAAPDGQPFAQDLDSDRVDAGLAGHKAVGGGLLLGLRGSVSRRNERRVFGDAVERGTRFTAFAETVLRGTSGRHSWLVGGALQADSYQARDLPRFDYSFAAPGLFAQDEARLGARAVLGISARLDHHDAYGPFFSPRLSLLFRPATGWTARLSAGAGFFAPTPFLEETEETGLARLLPLRGLVAERAGSASFDLGWARGSIDLNATLFGSEVRHPAVRRPVGPERFAIENASPPVTTWGVELLARYRREGFMLLITHTLTRSTEGDPASEGRRAVPLTPRHLGGLNAIWEGESWGRVGLEAYYTGRQPLEDDPYRSEGRGYLLFGALAERRFARLRVFVNAENLGNVRQTRWAPLLRPTRAPDGRWTVEAWAPLDGFVVNGGVRVLF